MLSNFWLKLVFIATHLDSQTPGKQSMVADMQNSSVTDRQNIHVSWKSMVAICQLGVDCLKKNML